jgi:hypothetical protein
MKGLIKRGILETSLEIGFILAPFLGQQIQDGCLEEIKLK